MHNYVYVKLLYVCIYMGVYDNMIMQSCILSDAGIYSLDNMVNRISEDHQNAQELAAAISDINHIEMDIKKVTTNLIFFHLRDDQLSDQEFLHELLKHNIKIDDKGNRRFRMATHSRNM